MVAWRAGSRQYLLDLDLELAEALDPRLRPRARTSATALTFQAEIGDVALAERLAQAAPGPGVLILDGVVAASVSVADRVTAELLGPGDLIEPAEQDEVELLWSATAWRALIPLRYALLDAAFAERVRPWPQVAETLLRRAQRRAHNLNLLRAVACQPRLEVRLTLLLWHLASRWGRVEPGGIRLPLPLTHQLLGRLVGAERPSVSHALGRLARAGTVTGHGEEWHLHGDVEQQLQAIGEPAGDPMALLMGTATRREG